LGPAVSDKDDLEFEGMVEDWTLVDICLSRIARLVITDNIFY
jgi:hypothetical protein